jgi:hypothetical protein
MADLTGSKTRKILQQLRLQWNNSSSYQPFYFSNEIQNCINTDTTQVKINRFCVDFIWEKNIKR